MIIQDNLFYGEEVSPEKNIQYKVKNTSQSKKSFYWVQTKLVRESGPWYAMHLTSPDAVYKMLRDHLDIENLDREHFIVIYLNRKGVVNAAQIVSIGGLHSSLVHPREVFKTALLTSSASLILAHNHPSGDPTPSPEDIDVTKSLIQAGKAMSIEILDHIIIGSNKFESLKSRGLM